MTSLSAVFADDRAINNLEFSTLSGNQLQIQLDMNGQAMEPKIFQTDNPARIAMDFVGVKSNLAKKSFPINQGAAGTVFVVESGGRTRVIVNLVEKVPYETKIADNKFYLLLKPASGILAASKITTDNRSSEAPSITQPAANPVKDLAISRLLPEQAINNIDFRRGQNGEGRVLITLSAANTVIDAKQKAGKVVLNFLNTRIPESLTKVYDVSDFATPVQKFETRPHGENVSLTIIPNNDSYEYSTYQTDNLLTVEFRPLSPAEKEALKKEKFPYSGDKLSLNFQDIEIRSVLQILADFTELNIIAADSVVGNVTLRLNDVPWDQALELILKSKGLGKRQNGNVVMIAPLSEIMKIEQEALDSQRISDQLEPLKTEYVQINYAKASEICSILMGIGNSNLGGSSGGGGVSVGAPSQASSGGGTGGGAGQGCGGGGGGFGNMNQQQGQGQGQGGGGGQIGLRLLSARGVAIIDARTNTIIIKDTSQALEEVRKMIKMLDVPIRQVMIETRIVVANNNFLRQLGANFNVQTQGTNAAQAAGTYPGLQQLGYAMNGALTAASGGTSQLAMTLAAGANHLLDLEIEALQNEDRGEQLGNPRVMTTDRVKASIKQGVQIPYTTQTANQVQTSFVDAVLQLDVTPQITPGGSVIMDLLITDDSQGAVITTSGNQTVAINKKSLTAKVQVEDGETVVLGGVYESNLDNSVSVIPWFSDLPGIGWMFKYTAKTDNKQELLIFVTPKIVKSTLKGK
ncbi:MAG: type IV pilus secretin PilQ [Methylomonas sp.]|jgi:type IV pilus assembly protein PilQ